MCAERIPFVSVRASNRVRIANERDIALA